MGVSKLPKVLVGLLGNDENDESGDESDSGSDGGKGSDETNDGQTGPGSGEETPPGTPPPAPPERRPASEQPGEVVDVKDHGYPGDRSGGDLTTLFEQKPDCTFRLEAGGHYEMSTWRQDSYRSFGLVAPTPGCRPRIYARNPCRDAKGEPLQQHFFELGGHSGERAGNSVFRNLVFVTEPEKTSRHGWRFDHGVMKAAFDGDATIENVALQGRRHSLEGIDGNVRDHGSRYNNRIEGASKSANITIRRFDMPDGGRYVPENGVATGHAIGFAVEKHYGSITFEQCYLDGVIDNSFYLPPHSGDGDILATQCAVTGEIGNSAFRAGKNTTIEQCFADVSGSAKRKYRPVALNLQRGENTTVDGMHIKAFNHANDIIRVSPSSTGADVSNLLVETDSSVNGVEIQSVVGDGVHARNLTFRGCTFIDKGDGSSKPAFVKNSRPGTTFRDCTFASPNRSAIWDLGGVNVDGCDFSTGEWALRMGHYYKEDVDGPTGTVRFIGNDVFAGSGLQLESTTEPGMLVARENDFSRCESPFGDLAGTAATEVLADNCGVV